MKTENNNLNPENNNLNPNVNEPRELTPEEL